MATRATLITHGMATMRPELRCLLHQAQERCPSTDDADVLTTHVEALASVNRDHPRVVILNPQGEINRHGLPRKDRLGCSTNNRTNS